MRPIGRVRFLAGGAAALALATPVIAAPGDGAAQFRYKYGHDNPVDNPIHVRAVEMAEQIKRETGGRLEIQVFAGNALGSDPAMIEQMRVGALEFSCQSGPALSGLVPTAGIQSVPYAFGSVKDAIEAQNGELGETLRREIAVKTGFHAFPVILDGGFKQITSSTHPIRTVADLTGFKIRTPAGAIFVDVYRTLGADVAVLTLAETYTALKTRLVDGQDNPYILIEQSRFYEVQKYLSVMNATWGAQWVFCSGDAWKALPPDIQAVVEKNVPIYAKRQQRDNALLNDSLADKLRRQGLAFNTADRDSFKVRLAPWYAKQKAFYGPRLWGLLEKYGNQLG